MNGSNFAKGAALTFSREGQNVSQELVEGEYISANQLLVYAAFDGAGSWTVRVDNQEANMVSNEFVFIVVDQADAPGDVLGVFVNPVQSPLELDETLQLVAKVIALGLTSTEVTWASSNPTVASVGRDSGLVTALEPGTAEVTATSVVDPSKSATVTIETEGWTRLSLQGHPYTLGIATDSAGNVIAVKDAFGDGDSGAGLQDVLVEKWDRAGNLLWTQMFGTPAVDNATAVATDSQDNILVAGNTRGDLVRPNYGESDVFIRKLRPDGSIAWTIQIGTAFSEIVHDVAADLDGNVYLAIQRQGLGPSLGNSDGVVYKLTSGGIVEWSRRISTSGSDAARAIAVDTLGGIIVAGDSGGDLSGNTTLPMGAFVRRYDLDGEVVWTHQFGAEGEMAFGVTADSSGAVFVVGSTWRDLAGTKAGISDVFVRKLTFDGLEEWTQQFGEGYFGYNEGRGVETDGDGNLIVVGFTEGNLAGPNFGNVDAFVRKIAPDGTELWTEQFGTSGGDIALRVATDSHNNILVGGTTTGHLGGVNYNSQASFVRKLPPYP